VVLPFHLSIQNWFSLPHKQTQPKTGFVASSSVLLPDIHRQRLQLLEVGDALRGPFYP